MTFFHWTHIGIFEQHKACTIKIYWFHNAAYLTLIETPLLKILTYTLLLMFFFVTSTRFIVCWFLKKYYNTNKGKKLNKQVIIWWVNQSIKKDTIDCFKADFRVQLCDAATVTLEWISLIFRKIEHWPASSWCKLIKKAKLTIPIRWLELHVFDVVANLASVDQHIFFVCFLTLQLSPNKTKAFTISLSTCWVKQD